MPHSGVSWEDTARLLAWMDATKQLSLSRHAPAYLGHEPCVVAEVGVPAPVVVVPPAVRPRRPPF